MRKLIFILIALISFSQAQTIQYIGAPTTTVISRGNFRTDSIFYLPKRTKTPTDTAAFRYQISDSSLYYWTGYQWTKVQSASSFASVDTLVISTRAWRQKGIDSVQYNVGLKVNISDTSSMLLPYIRHAGYGLTKTSQALSVDTALMATRLRVGKVVDSLSLVKQNVLTNPVTGTGTTNYLPKFTGTSTIGNSQIFDNGTNVGINTTPSAKLHILGNEIRIQDDNALLGFRNASGTRIGYIQNRSDAMDIWNDQSSPMIFGTSNTDRGRIKSDGEWLLNTSTDNGAYTLQVNGDAYIDAVVVGSFNESQSNNGLPHIIRTGGGGATSPFNEAGHLWIQPRTSIARNIYFANGTTTPSIAATITSSNELLINTTTDAGAYTLQNNGALYNTGSAILAATSGNVGIGTTSPVQKFVVSNAGSEGFEFIPGASSNSNQLLSYNRATSAYSTLVVRASDYNIQIGTTAAYYINASQESLFGTLTDAGNYRVQVSGNAYVSNRLSVATTSTNASIVSYNATNSIFSLLTNGEIYNREVGSSASNNTVEVHIRPYAGKSGYLTFTENAVADRWAIGIQNGNSGLRFLTGGALGTETIKFQTNGGIRYVPQSAAPTAEAGTVYYDSDDNKLKVYNGTTWVDLH